MGIAAALGPPVTDAADDGNGSAASSESEAASVDWGAAVAAAEDEADEAAVAAAEDEAEERTTGRWKAGQGWVAGADGPQAGMSEDSWSD